MQKKEKKRIYFFMGICSGELLWGGNVALGRKFTLGSCSGELLWGGNVALGRQCCSGEKFALGSCSGEKFALGSCSGELLWGVALGRNLLWGAREMLGGGNVALGRQCCSGEKIYSGEKFALGSCSGEAMLLWEVVLGSELL